MKEIRLSVIKAETRAEPTAEGKRLVLYGRAILYDTPTTIKDAAGSYIEIIKAGALDGADLTDVRLLYNHDANKIPLARSPKTMSFAIDAAGLTFTAELPDTEEARAVYIAVERGDLSGCSFAFTVPDGGDNYDPATNTRTIYKIKKVYEFSICPFPAYPQTSVEARDARSAGLEKYRARQRAQILINQILLKK